MPRLVLLCLGLSGALGIIEVHPGVDAGPRCRDAVIGSQVHLFIFDRAPEPLDEDIVPPGPFAIHADLDVRIFQCFDEIDGGELAGLIGVHYVGLAIMAQRFIQRLNAGGRFKPCR